MLAQSFLSAADLGITEPQLSALQKTLVLLEAGKLEYVANPDEIADGRFFERRFIGLFNMGHWATPHSCGTVCCIGGTAELIGDVSFGRWSFSNNLRLIGLFAPQEDENLRWNTIAPAQAATALRSYLTCGDAKWHEAVAESPGALSQKEG